MQRDFDPLELLALWWKYESGWNHVQGYPTECPSTAAYRSSRQYDSDNGAFETDTRGMFIRHVSGVIQNMDDPHRTALYVLAKNLVTGEKVWTSARLPDNKDARIRITAEAVELFSRLV